MWGRLPARDSSRRSPSLTSRCSSPTTALGARVGSSLRRRRPAEAGNDVVDTTSNTRQTDSVSIPVSRLNHAVLFVRDASAAADFYGRVFGFEVVGTEMAGQAIFMRAAGGENHHDLGL